MENNLPKTKKFDQIYIDNRDKNFSNEEFFYIIIGLTGGINGGIDYKDENFFFEGEELTIHDRILSICFLVSYITDIGLLTQILRYLGIFGLVDHVDKGLKKYLSNAASGGFYSKTDAITVLAVYHSLTSVYNFYIKILKSPKSKPPKPLIINFKNRMIEHNLNEVIRSIHKNNVKQVRIDIAKFPIEEQIFEVNKWIRILVEAGYDADSKIFKKDVKYLKEIKKCLVDQKIITPGQPESIIPGVEYFFSTKTAIPRLKTNQKNNIPENFIAFIFNVNDKEKFASDLKKAFNVEGGKNLRIMTNILIEESIIIIADNKLFSYHSAMKKYFERDIKGYESFRKANNFDKTSIDLAKKKLDPLIAKYKTTT